MDIEETIIEKLKLPENASPAAQAYVLGELLTVVQDLVARFEKFQSSFELVKEDIDDLMPFIEKDAGTKIDDVIEGETGNGEWVPKGKVWIDPDGYIKNQGEYESYQKMKAIKDAQAAQATETTDPIEGEETTE